MEGKEYRDEEDDQNSNSSDNNDSFGDQDSGNESDDFGLPEVEDADSTYSNESEEDSFEDSYSTDSDDYSYSSESDYSSDSDQNDYSYSSDQDYDDYNQDEPQEETNDQRDYYIHGLDDDDKKSSSAGWIIAIIIFILLAAGGYYWFFMREQEPAPQPKPKPKPKVEEVVKDTATVVEEEPMIQDTPESSTVAGEVVEVTSPTGRYYVIVASFIDDDLAMDYGNKLAKDGVGSMVLSPKTEKGFYRLALADFESLNDATLESERLKSTYGEDVWVIRY